MMKGRRGLFITALGLAAGLLAGIGIRALETYLEHEIFLALKDEVSASCDCTLEYDSLSLSLLRRSGVAGGVRIIEKGEKKLSVGKVTANFGLSKIFSRRIELTSLLLSKVTAKGVGEDSVTYRFIDRLTAPSAPGHTPIIKVELLNLKLTDGSFLESLGEQTLAGNGIALEVSRNAQENFDLVPKIQELKIIFPPYPDGEARDVLLLGNAESRLTIEDLRVAFHEVVNAISSSKLVLNAVSQTKEGNALSGGGTVTLHPGDYGFSDVVSGALTGNATLSGTLGRPIVDLNLTSTEAPLAALFDDQAIAQFPALKALVHIDARDRPPTVIVPSLSESTDEHHIELAQPIEIRDEKLSGAFKLHFNALNLPGVLESDQADISFTLGGTAGNPFSKLDGTLHELRMFGMRLNDVHFNLDVDRFNGTLHAEHRVADGGLLAIATTLSRGRHESWRWSDIQISAERYPLPGLVDSKFPALASGTATLGGLSDPTGIRSAGSFVVTSTLLPGLELPATMKLENGNLKVQMEDSAKHLSISTSGSLREPQSLETTITVAQLALRDYQPDAPCIDIDGKAVYRFSPRDALKGNGELALQKVSVGCAPYSLSQSTGSKLPIRGGVLLLDGFKLQSGKSTVDVTGNTRLDGETNIGLKTSLELESLLSFMPSLDLLAGRVDAVIAITGPIAGPNFNGKATLTNASFAMESADLSGTALNGTVTLNQNLLKLDSLRGLLNGGSLDGGGEMQLFTNKPPLFHVSFHDALLEPASDVSAVISGDLSVSERADIGATLTGTITVSSAEFRQRIDALTIVRTIRDLIFTPEPNGPTPKRAAALSMDVTLNIPGNALVVTNWAGAELAGSIRATGPLSQPSLQGEVQALSGWFGFKSRRFEITSGRVIFSPESEIPSLELVSETTVRSAFGENVFMVLEARGPIDRPALTLTSDSGLSEAQLLNLFAAGGGSNDSYFGRSTDPDLELQESPLLSRDSVMHFDSLIRSLASLDLISLEPTYNEQTGAIEPTVIAQKKLTNFFSLFAQNSLTSSSGDSKAGGILEVTPDFNLIGSVESRSSNKTNAIGVDAAFTILSAQPTFIAITVSGLEKIDEDALLRGLRLSPRSRVRPDDTTRIARDAVRFLSGQGYSAATVSVNCTKVEILCRELRLEVEEGPQSTVEKVSIIGEWPAEVQLPDTTIAPDIGATRELLDEYQSSLLKILRNEGYIAARVDPQYLPGSTEQQKVLELSVVTGKPVTFVFKGNTVFSEVQLLDTINLFERRHPFGSNTIQILTTNIERKYREAGYLYASISWERNEDPQSKRIVYSILINEEDPAQVHEVTFDGEQGLSREVLIEKIRVRDPLLPARIFSPRRALAEEIQNYTDIISDVYREAGYPSAKVNFEILPNVEGNEVDIIYHIDEGPSELHHWLEIPTMPPDIKAIELPKEPYPIPQANIIIDSLLRQYRDNGYLFPELRTTQAKADGPVELTIIPGMQVRIGTIEFEGLRDIGEQPVRHALKIDPGAIWTEELLQDARRRLIHLGLFSQVELTARDGTIDSPKEDLVVRVIERPLRTLEAGGGANSEYGIHLFGEGSDRTLLSDGRYLTLRFDTYYDRAQADISRGIANLRYSDPTFLDSDYLHTEDLRFQRLDRSAQEFELERTSFGSYLHRSFDDGTALSVGHTILEENLSNVSPDAVISDLDTGIVDLSFLAGTVNFDGRDSPLAPTNGYTAAFDSKLSAKGIGSDADFFSLGGRGTYILPLDEISPRLTVSTGVHGAASWTFGSTSEVPISQRFYLGGRNTVRGFRENSLGPRGDDGSVIGGDILTSASGELQYALDDFFSVHLFLDSGTVFLRDRGADLGDLRYGTGAGFRFRSPIGPIGFDIGHPLDEQSGEPSVRVHFSIGSNF